MQENIISKNLKLDTTLFSMPPRGKSHWMKKQNVQPSPQTLTGLLANWPLYQLLYPLNLKELQKAHDLQKNKGSHSQTIHTFVDVTPSQSKSKWKPVGRLENCCSSALHQM